jgi:hypothetical protein
VIERKLLNHAKLEIYTYDGNLFNRFCIYGHQLARIPPTEEQFQEYSKIGLSNQMSGAEIAQKNA